MTWRADRPHLARSLRSHHGGLARRIYVLSFMTSGALPHSHLVCAGTTQASDRGAPQGLPAGQQPLCAGHGRPRPLRNGWRPRGGG